MSSAFSPEIKAYPAGIVGERHTPGATVGERHTPGATSVHASAALGSAPPRIPSQAAASKKPMQPTAMSFRCMSDSP
jgi:hypothetical protein